MQHLRTHHERPDALHELVWIERADLLPVQCGQLHHVERGRVAGHALEVKGFDQLRDREAFGDAVADRPIQQHQVVDQRLGQEAFVAIRGNRRVAVALRQRRAIGADDERHVCVPRRSLRAQRARDHQLLRRAREDVLAADDVRDSHRLVVVRDCQQIDRRAVRAHDDEVGDLRMVPVHSAVDEIVDHGLPRLDEEPDRRLASFCFERRALGLGQVATAAVVAGRPSGCQRGLAPLLQLLRRAVALVRVPLFEQPVGCGLIQREPLRLAVGLVRPADVRALVPQQAEPAKVLEKRTHGLLGRARRVCIRDPKHERAVVLARVQPVERGRHRVADVDRSARCGFETDADGLLDGHGSRVYPAAFTGFRSVPMPSISTSTTSPGSTAPTPAGVPVQITSPGSNVITRDTNDTSCTGPKIISLVFASWVTSPLTRTERVVALCACPLPFALAEVARRQVVRARVAEDRGLRRFLVGVPHEAVDHDGQLGLMFQDRNVPRFPDRILGADHRGGRLQREQRLLGDREADRFGDRWVVQADGDHLRRKDWREQPAVGQRRAVPREAQPACRRPVELGDLIAFDHAERDGAPTRHARDLHSSVGSEWISPKFSASTSACQDASMMFGETPIVDHSRVPSCDSISTRVTESVPAFSSRMRTL